MWPHVANPFRHLPVTGNGQSAAGASNPLQGGLCPFQKRARLSMEHPAPRPIAQPQKPAPPKTTGAIGGSVKSTGEIKTEDFPITSSPSPVVAAPSAPSPPVALLPVVPPVVPSVVPHTGTIQVSAVEKGPSSNANTPLAVALQTCVYGKELDLNQAARIVLDEVYKGVDVRNSVKIFADYVARFDDVSVEYPLALYYAHNMGVFQCASIIASTILDAKLRLQTKLWKTAGFRRKIDLSALKFDHLKLRNTYVIPECGYPFFKTGELINLGSVKESSKAIHRQVNMLLREIVLGLCNPPDRIQQFHFQPTIRTSDDTVPLPRPIYMLISDVLLDALGLKHDLVQSYHPPTEQEKALEFYQGLGENQAERLERLEVLREHHFLLTHDIIPFKVSELLREYHNAKFTEIDGKVNVIYSYNLNRTFSAPNSRPSSSSNTCNAAGANPGTL